MPKRYTCPTLFDDVHTLSIKKLKEWGYLDHNKSGDITWSNNGQKTGSISITSYHDSTHSCIELDYKSRGLPIQYIVHLTKVPSNLGKGYLTYFLCPHTGKRCRILYCISGYFYHRKAFHSCMYESQTWSKRSREMIKFLTPDSQYESTMQELHSKHFKKFYNGQPTKRYKKLMDRLKRAEAIPLGTLERFLDV